MENKYSFCKAGRVLPVSQQGKVTSSRELGSLLYGDVVEGLEKPSVPGGFGKEAEQSQCPSTTVGEGPGVLVLYPQCSVTLQPWLCHLPQQDSPEAGAL